MKHDDISIYKSMGEASMEERPDNQAQVITDNTSHNVSTANIFALEKAIFF